MASAANFQRAPVLSHSQHPLRLHVLQHVPFEGPAGIADWAAERGHAVAVSVPPSGEPLPDLDTFDWLVAMGGPMSVNDPLPWLRAEERLIAHAVGAGKRVLGVCLGAQLLARALGAPVFRGTHPEVGWLPVRRVRGTDGPTVFDGLPAEFLAYHWHGEAFNLPPGAVRLAESDACRVQAFQYGPCAVGLQFHLEATPASVAALLAHCAADIGSGPFERPPAEHLVAPERFVALGGVLRQVLTWLEAPR